MISVVVPVYNVEKYIVKCLKSIVDQDYKDFELLVINDGSTDQSVQFAEDFLSKRDINWRVINKENGGLASARNKGIEESKGDFIAFVDSDDTISYDFLSKLYKELDESDADFSFCSFSFTKEQQPPNDDNKKKIVFDRETLLNVFLKRTIRFLVPSMMFRKEFILKHQLFFDEEIKFSEDQPYIWKAILFSDKSVYLYKMMYGYYIRENSIMTSTSYSKILNSFREFERYTNDLFSIYPEFSYITNKVLPRWELGALYSASHLITYQDFRKLYKEMDGRTILNRIQGIGERNAYLLAMVAKISPRLLYELCRRMDLNG